MVFMSLLNCWQSLGLTEQIEVIRLTVMIISTFAAVFGAVYVYRNFKINEKKLLTDRFSKAVEQLGTTSNRTVVLGGIYALSKIAQDSPEYHWLVMKVIASFIRGKALEFAPREATNTKDYPRVYPQIQEAINVIAQRDYTKDLHNETLDLSGSVLFRANLANANFKRVNLREANFGQTNLKGVDFSEANLEKASFLEADLSQAILQRTNLKEAIYCNETKFPSNFDPDVEGMKKNPDFPNQYS